MLSKELKRIARDMQNQSARKVKADNGMIDWLKDCNPSSVHTPVEGDYKSVARESKRYEGRYPTIVEWDAAGWDGEYAEDLGLV